MYLKIVRYFQPDVSPTESLIECRHVWHGKVRSGEYDGYLLVEVDENQFYFTEKEQASFFVMNEGGKTIDSFMWTPTQDDQAPITDRPVVVLDDEKYEDIETGAAG